MFQVTLDPNEGKVPTLDVLSRMRDSIVSSVRVGLLSSLFIDRPDDLHVSGHVTNDVIEISVKDAATTDDFSRRISMEEFLGKDGRLDPSETVQELDRSQDHLFTPRLELRPRVELKDFKNEKRVEDTRQRMLEITQEKVNEFVSEYLKLKA